MNTLPSNSVTVPQAGRPRLRWVIVAFVLLGAVVAIALVKNARDMAKPAPEFPSLVAQPDPSLRGAVAYYGRQKDRGCVRVVAASGRAVQDVLCFGEGDGGTGPQLRWLPDGRLEVTVFHWTAGKGLSRGWQKLVDVTTGVVTEVPAPDVPDQPTATPTPAVGPNGQEVTSTSKGGKITVLLTDSGQTRTLLSASGNPDYGIHLNGQPVWSPGGDWVIVADSDGRLLLVTVDDPATTRILAEDVAGIGMFSSFEAQMLAATDVEPGAGT